MTKSTDPRRRAALLYWQRQSLAQISEEIGVSLNTLYSWRRRDQWEAKTPIQRIELTLEDQVMQLAAKKSKSNTDLRDIDFFMRQIERAARINPGASSSHGGIIVGPDDQPKRKRGMDIEKIAAACKGAFLDSIFQYQKVWYDAGLVHRIRNILKSRQIGATWFFAREALVDALETGRNQIFLSASRAQAHVFRQYIVAFYKEVTGKQLKGDPIILPNGATLYFLGTSSKTAQSYHGNLYFDEYAWVSKFLELRKVASGMAIHKKWRQTFFTTPSTLAHDSYLFWSGKLFNRGRARANHVEIDLSHSSLAEGRACEDGQWRQIITVEDAIAGGCDLFDLDQLYNEYSAEEIANLLMCQFMDDATATFTFTMLLNCCCDSWGEWDDLRPFAERPLANSPVWIGYDCSLTGDNSALAVLSPPDGPGGAFRLIERLQFNDPNYQSQSDKIRAMTKRYNVQHIAIDVTGGYGEAVYQLVKDWYPLVKPLRYTMNDKIRLVLKAQNVINKRRLLFDHGARDVISAFLNIKRTVTPSGQYVTFRAGRSEEASHSDIAWAIMNALENEALTEEDGNTKRTVMEIY